KRIESVDETVLLPHAFPVRTAQMAQHSDAIVEEKRQRAARRARHDAPIDRSLRRWAAPRRVAFHIIGSADPPEALAIVGKTVAQREAKKFVGLGGFHGILKIIRVGVALIPEIEPRVRI